MDENTAMTIIGSVVFFGGVVIACVAIWTANRG